MTQAKRVVHMAVQIVASIVLAAPAISSAQNTFPVTGNVGIGTTSPSGLLSLGGASGIKQLVYDGNLDYNAGFGTDLISGMNSLDIFAGYGNGANTAINFVMPTGAWPFTAFSSKMTVLTNGNVGIGTTAPTAKLELNGNLKLTSGSGASMTYADGTTQTTAWTGVLCGGDYAEAVNASGGNKHYEPGDVLVLASEGKEDVQKSTQPYSTLVAGIYATKPGVIGRRQNLVRDADDVPMAMIGIVPTKVSAENGAIRRGDLLVTSATPGYAMKGTDRSRLVGAVIGNAMGTLDSGNGVIEVLVTLQ